MSRINTSVKSKQYPPHAHRSEKLEHLTRQTEKVNHATGTIRNHKGDRQKVGCEIGEKDEATTNLPSQRTEARLR